MKKLITISIIIIASLTTIFAFPQTDYHAPACSQFANVQFQGINVDATMYGFNNVNLNFTVPTVGHTAGICTWELNTPINMQHCYMRVVATFRNKQRTWTVNYYIINQNNSTVYEIFSGVSMSNSTIENDLEFGGIATVSQ